MSRCWSETPTAPTVRRPRELRRPRWSSQRRILAKVEDNRQFFGPSRPGRRPVTPGRVEAKGDPPAGAFTPRRGSELRDEVRLLVALHLAHVEDGVVHA